MRWGSAVRMASWRSDIGLVPALQGLVTDRMGAVAAEQAETRTGVNGDILGSSVPDKGQKHGHRSQNVCRFSQKEDVGRMLTIASLPKASSARFHHLLTPGSLTESNKV